MRIKDLHKIDLPRERLEKYGPAKLKDEELLAILLGSGIKGVNVLELSRRVLKKVRELGTEHVTLAEFTKIRGLGTAKAAQVIALLTLGRRLANSAHPEILTAKDVWNLCADFRGSKREHFAAFYLDTQNRLIERQIVSVGTLDSSLVHPREVFEPALRLSAASVIVAHNHPSGNIQSSSADKMISGALKSAGNLLGVTLADHVIVSTTTYQCINERGSV